MGSLQILGLYMFMIKLTGNLKPKSTRSVRFSQCSPKTGPSFRLSRSPGVYSRLCTVKANCFANLPPLIPVEFHELSRWNITPMFQRESCPFQAVFTRWQDCRYRKFYSEDSNAPPGPANLPGSQQGGSTLTGSLAWFVHEILHGNMESPAKGFQFQNPPPGHLCFTSSSTKPL